MPNRAAWSGVGGVVTVVMATLAATSPLWPMWAALAVVGFYFTLAPLLQLRPWRHLGCAEEHESPCDLLDRPYRELDCLVGIVQSDAPGYSVTERRGELSAISRRVRRLLRGRPDLRALYDSPRPERQPDGKLMDHDERIFEAELEYRRNTLVKVAARLAREGAR